MAGDLTRLNSIAEGHNGILTITEIQDCGFPRSWASVRVRSGRWQRVHRGVYATFPIPLTWEQRARAGLLFAGTQAALAGHAAGFLHGLVRTAPPVIEILVPHSTLLQPTTGLLLLRTRRRFVVGGNPRRTGLLDTVLDLADRATGEKEVLDILTSGIRRGVNVGKLRRAMEQRRYCRNRSLLRELLEETPDGVQSPLEFRFIVNVVRAHGLPLPRLQVRTRVRGYWIRSDNRFDDYGLRVELDGEIAHPGRATNRDVMRDIDVLLMTGDRTLRFRWWNAMHGACLTAAQLAFALNLGGWAGEPTPCGPGCTVLAEYRALRRRMGA